MNKNYYIRKLDAKGLEEVFGYNLQDMFSITRLLDSNIIKEQGLLDAIIYNYDSVISDRISKIEIDAENIIEARLFNDNSEIRVFNDESILSGIIFSQKENVNPIIQEVILYPRYKEEAGHAKKLKIKKYFDYDEDNQAFISYIKPSRLIF